MDEEYLPPLEADPELIGYWRSYGVVDAVSALVLAFVVGYMLAVVR